MTMFDMTPLFRTTIGFDQLAQTLNAINARQDSSASYPPYDIIMDGSDNYRITMSVAGLAPPDLTIEVYENKLSISGKKEKTDAHGEFLHRGIAEHDFKTDFQLADHVEVAGANLSEGLLTIDLVRNVPEALKPTHIEIKTSSPPGLIGKAKKLLSDKSPKVA